MFSDIGSQLHDLKNLHRLVSVKFQSPQAQRTIHNGANRRYTTRYTKGVALERQLNVEKMVLGHVELALSTAD